MNLPKATHLLLFVLLAPLHLAWAGGLVTQPTEADLQAALSGGGTVTFACNGTITLTQTLNITQDTTLDAGGYQVTISGGNAVRLFTVTNALLRVNGLTLADGRIIGTNGTYQIVFGLNTPGPGQDALGACLLNQSGTVELTGCTLTNHLVQGGDGAMGSDGYYGAGGRGLGGAIYSSGGQLNLTNCSLVGCAATGGTGGPGVAGASALRGSGVGYGGALCVYGSGLNFQNVTLAGNRATGGPGQVGYSSSTPGADACGGALYAVNATVCAGSCVLAGNAATGGGPPGGVVLLAPGTGNGSGGALFLDSISRAVFNQCAFSGNSAASVYPGSGHASAGSGWGGAVFNQGQFQAVNSTFSGNVAAGAGGMYGVRQGQGGALYSTNTLVLSGCTFDGNTARGGGGYSYIYPIPGGPGEGGAIWSSGVLAATNTTWSGNRAQGGRYPYYVGDGEGPSSGGALCVTGGAATLVNVTVAGNSVGPDAGLVAFGPAQGGNLMNANGTVWMRGSILAYGTTITSGYTGATLVSGSNVWGTVTDGGYNLSSDCTGDFTLPGSLTNTDPLLGALTDNGGPTATLMLGVGSPARDAMPEGYPPTDQRGVARPQGAAADMGAVEAPAVPTTRVTVQTVPSGLSIIADGTNVVRTPHNFFWETGSCHTLDASTPGTGAQGTNVQYFWTAWDDGGAVSHQVCAGEDMTNMASFRAQYYLAVSPGANAGGTVSSSNGWYDDGQTVTISAVPNSGFTFSGWTGRGTGGSYSGPDNPAQVTMNGWVSQTALFTYTNPCSFSLSPTNADFPPSQELGVVLVSNGDTNCAWTVVSPCDWVVVTSGGGQGAGAVNYFVKTNSDINPRSCTLTIAGQPFTVTQAGRCVYSLDSSGTNIDASAMSGLLYVTTTGSCSWTAVSSVAWLHITNNFGTGPSVIGYSVEANANTNSRTGTIIVADQVFTVFQAGVSVPVFDSFTRGTYHGLVSVAEAPVGRFTLLLTGRGTFTGRLFVEGTGYSFLGGFDLHGKANRVVPRRGKAALGLNLQLEGTKALVGTVAEQSGAWMASLRADRAVFSASSPCGYAGQYTFVLPGNTNSAVLPGGDGFGTFKVDARGRAALAGSLADGTAFASSTSVAEDGRVPLFVPLYRGQGLLSAWVQLPLDSTNTLSGQGVWLKPAGARLYRDGFDAAVSLFGMKFTGPAHEKGFGFTNGIVAIAGANLPEALSVPVKLSSNKAAPVGASNLRLSFNTASGKFSGSFSLPPARTSYRFQGIMIRPLQSGYGYFLDTNQSGSVRISAEP